MGARTFLLVVALLALAGRAAEAQSSAAQSAVVSADVVSGLTVLVDRGLAFGVLTQGAGTQAVGLTSPKAAKVRFYGQKNRNVTVTLTLPAQITSGANNLPVTWNAQGYHNTADDPTTATTFTGTSTTVRLQGNITGNTGYAYLWLGGQITVGAATPVGLYQGTITISAVY